MYCVCNLCCDFDFLSIYVTIHSLIRLVTLSMQALIKINYQPMSEEYSLLFSVYTRLWLPKFLGNNVILCLHLSHKDESDMPEYECGSEFSLQSELWEHDSGRSRLKLTRLCQCEFYESVDSSV